MHRTGPPNRAHFNFRNACLMTTGNSGSLIGAVSQNPMNTGENMRGRGACFHKK